MLKLASRRYALNDNSVSIACTHDKTHFHLCLTSRSGCTFVQELQTMTAVDMPPEAILQRPSILQHVLALLKPADKASSLPKSALHFLLCFVCRVKQALSMAVNPEFVPTASGVS